MFSSSRSGVLLMGLALTAKLASAVSIAERADDPTLSCSPWSRGTLAVIPKGGDAKDATYVGIVSGVKHAGIDGKQASLIVTKDDQGRPLSPQAWDFNRCQGHQNQVKPDDGAHFPANQTAEQYFGIIQPHGAHTHCLTIETGNDGGKGDTNSILDSVCSSTSSTFRTWYSDTTAESTYNYLTFASGNQRLFISDTKHAELVLVDADSYRGKTEMQLVILENH